jgi:hypothetical protein
MSKKVFVSPTDDDLMIPGLLLKIDINQLSFSFSYQSYLEKLFTESYNVHVRTFPIEYLQKFFEVNSKLPVDFYCPRVTNVEPVKSVRNGI